ncbi:MAG: SwmB domain-containing protein [Gemmatimonadota bacterium]|nr:SwmB domain-containing protein [Gemmatimonadota bacterium]
MQGASYEARVRATNSEGASDWSAATSGHTGPARVVSAETNEAGTLVFATFTKNIGAFGLPDQYGVRVNVGRVHVPQQTSSDDAGRLVIRLFDSQTAQHGDTRTLEYTAPAAGAALADADGLGIASFSGQSITNNVPPPAPTVTKATLQGTVLEITFSQTLGALPTQLQDAFTVKLGTTTQTLRTNSPVSISGSVLSLVLAAAPGAGAVTVSYAKPATAGGRLTGADGSEVESFTDQAVIRPATVQSATTSENGGEVQITFTKNISGAGVSQSQFTVTIQGNTVPNRSPSAISISGAVLTLTLRDTVTVGETVLVRYHKPTTGTKLTDSDDLEIETFLNQSVTNAVPTVFQSATTHATGREVTVTFTAPLKSAPLNYGRITVTADGTDQAINTAGILAGKLIITLGTAITAGQTVTVSYRKPATGKLIDNNDREVPEFTNEPVTNTVPVTITGIAITSDPGPDRIYQRDDVISVTVTFNAPVTVAGAPYLVMHFRRGGFPQQRDKQASYDSGSESNMLVFTYTVTSADNSAHEGIGLPANMLELNNGTIRAGSTDATLTYADVHHDDANHRVHGPTAQDVTGPAVSTATVNGASLVITFNEALDATGSAPAASAFTVKVGGTAVDLADTNPVAISGSAVTLTLAAAVIDADVVTVAYAKPSANPIQDFTAGNDAPSFGDTDVTNNTPGVAPTVLTDPAPAVGGTRLVITFSEPLHEAGTLTPATSAFTVMVAGNNRGVSNVAVSGATVILTLQSAAVFGEAVTVSYTQPSNVRRLQDRALTPNPVASFGPLTVTNNDNTAPTFSTAAVDGAALTITFDENLDGTSEPAASAFTVRVAGAGRTVSGVSLSAATVTLTLASAVTPGQTVTVSYAQPTANPLQDGATNKVANFGPETATNNTRAAVTGAPAVTSSPASGDTYGLGEHIEVTVTFSHPVTVTGTPQLELTVGTNNRQAAFLRGGGTTALVFRYTVVAADADADGISVGANKLTLPAGAAIQDAGNGAATLTHTALGAQTGHKVDGTLVRTAVTIAGGGPVAEGGNATFTLTASPAPSADITVNLGVSQSGNYVADADLGSKTVTVPTTGTATYTVPTVNDATDEPNGSVTVTVQAGAGYNVGAPDAASVTVNDNDAAPPPPPPTPTRPAFSRAAVSGTALTITFNRNLDTGSAPAGSAFTVTATPAGGSARSIPGTGTASIAGATVTVTLASAVAPGETVRVGYTRPSANPLRGAGSSGQEVTNFTGRSVANNTPTGPSAPPPQGGRVSGGGATVTLNFADELDASSTPDPGDFTVTSMSKKNISHFTTRFYKIYDAGIPSSHPSSRTGMQWASQDCRGSRSAVLIGIWAASPSARDNIVSACLVRQFEPLGLSFAVESNSVAEVPPSLRPLKHGVNNYRPRIALRRFTDDRHQVLATYRHWSLVNRRPRDHRPTVCDVEHLDHCVRGPVSPSDVPCVGHLARPPAGIRDDRERPDQSIRSLRYMQHPSWRRRIHMPSLNLVSGCRRVGWEPVGIPDHHEVSNSRRGPTM